MNDSALLGLAAEAISRCRDAGLRLVLAESLTGGLIAASLTEVAGSSRVLEGGFVVYSNAAKCAFLGVPSEMIAAYGAVSEPVVRAMAEGALARARAHIAVAVTGLAGPDGCSSDKPVGTVWLGCARQGAATLATRQNFVGGRVAIRRAAVAEALALIKQTAVRA